MDDPSQKPNPLPLEYRSGSEDRRAEQERHAKYARFGAVGAAVLFAAVAIYLRFGLPRPTVSISTPLGDVPEDYPKIFMAVAGSLICLLIARRLFGKRKDRKD